MRERTYFETMNSPVSLKVRDTIRRQQQSQKLQHSQDSLFAGVSLSERLQHFVIPTGVCLALFTASTGIGPLFSGCFGIVLVMYLRWIWYTDTQWLVSRELANEVPHVAELVAAELEVAPTSRMALTECLAHCPSENSARRVIYRMLLGDDIGRIGNASPLHTSALATLLETLPVSDRNGAARLRGWADSVREANHRLSKRENQIFAALRTLSLIVAILSASNFWIADRLPQRAMDFGDWGVAFNVVCFAIASFAFFGGYGVGALWRREVWRD